MYSGGTQIYLQVIRALIELSEEEDDKKHKNNFPHRLKSPTHYKLIRYALRHYKKSVHTQRSVRISKQKPREVGEKNVICMFGPLVSVSHINQTCSANWQKKCDTRIH